MTRACVMAGWDDVPHLSEKDKETYAANYLPHQRDARTKGIPSLGSGAIYPVAEDQYVINPMEIPDYWPRCAAMDVGWKRTAGLWGAWDRESDCLYVYSEHYQREQKPPIHASAIRARGSWIPICIDPSSRGRSQEDGSTLYNQYSDLGLNLYLADRSLEAGTLEVLTRLTDGRLKVFQTLTEFLGEIRMYSRDEKGKIVKANDHLMDCLRYLVMGFTTHAITKPSMHAEDMSQYVGVGDRGIGY